MCDDGSQLRQSNQHNWHYLVLQLVQTISRTKLQMTGLIEYRHISAFRQRQMDAMPRVRQLSNTGQPAVC